jgi:hypothetical protein
VSVRRSIVGVWVLCAAGAACSARAQALTPTGAPALHAPEPPARVVVPAPERPTLPPQPADAPPATAAGTPARGRDTAPPVSRPAAPPTPPAEPPVVTTPPLLTTAYTAEFENRVREQLMRAQADLGQVNRQNLGADARAQYDSALGFIRQAEEALKVKNLIYAGQLADKAATMAALLKR